MFYDLLIFIFMSYIKPQLVDPLQIQNLGCISYYSYIKPQLVQSALLRICVVYRTIPTSNHNGHYNGNVRDVVVYRTIPTSNHNCSGLTSLDVSVVYRTIPTSNHNCF